MKWSEWGQSRYLLTGWVIELLYFYLLSDSYLYMSEGFILVCKLSLGMSLSTQLWFNWDVVVLLFPSGCFSLWSHHLNLKRYVIWQIRFKRTKVLGNWSFIISLYNVNLSNDKFLKLKRVFEGGPSLHFRLVP